MPAPIAAAAGMAARVLTGGGRALMGGGRAVAAGGGRSATLRSNLRSKIGEISRQTTADLKSKVSLDVVLFIDPRFVKNLEDSVKKSMDRSGTLWARGMRRDMGASGTDGRISKPGRAPAIQSTALVMSIGHKHDKPNSGRTKFTMYVGSVGRQTLRRVPKERLTEEQKRAKLREKSPPSMKGRVKTLAQQLSSIRSKRLKGLKGLPGGGAKAARRALPHQYGYWLEYGKNKIPPSGVRFNVPFEARPWAGPGSSTHGLWVEGRYFLQDFREGMQKHLGRYLR